MNFNINVINQRMFLEEDSTLNGFANDSKEFVEGSQEFVKFHFTFSEEWDSLVTFAQFIQSGKGYNVYLDDNNNVYLPPEIKSGKCNLVLYGSRDKIIATTNYISLILNKYLLIKDASSTEITESLYNQLVNKVAEIAEKLNDKADKVDIPTKLSQLEDDPQHRVVTDAQIKKWNAGGGGDSMWQVVDLDFSGETATTTQSAQEIYSAMELGIYTVFVIRGVEGVQSAIADIYLPTKIYATTISGNSKIDFLVEDLGVRYTTDPLNRVDLDIIGGKVGQTIVIKTADENGVPTSWEVKDYPDLSNLATKDEVGVVDKKIDDYKISNDKVVGEKADKTELSKYALQSAVDLKADKEYVDTALLGKADSEAVTELSSKVDEALGATVTNADTISNLKTTKADKTEIPKNTSDLINDSNYVTAEELANAKEWQTAEITLTSESEGTSSLSSQEVYSAYLKGVYTAVSNKSEIGGDLYLVNTYTENVCVATMAREKSVSSVAIIGNNVALSSSNFATKKDIPTKTSQLTNDSDFATNASVDEKIANIPESSKDYNDLTNKPRINDIELKGNLTADELGIQGGGSDIKQFNIVLESAKWVETNYTFSDTRFKVDGFTYDIYVKPADYEKYGIEAKDITVDNEISFLSTSKPLENVTVTVIAYQMNVVPVGELEDLTIKVDGVAKVYNGTAPIEIDILSKQSGNYPISVEVELIKEIKPNVFYKWGEVASLNITFAPEAEDIVNDYHFSFKSGLAPTQLTLPDFVKWVSQPNIEASKTYEVSIVDNLGVICGA